MAVKPTELVQQIEQDITPIVKRLEGEIDAYLKDRAKEGVHDRILWSTQGQSPAVVRELVRLYKTAGWSVNSESDRDGTFIAFRFPVYREQPKPRC
jgi:hypothetical protein